MAWEATHLLLPVLLVLLVSGSWAQMLHRLEGEALSVRCEYDYYLHSKVKVWCRQTGRRCQVLVDSSRRVASRYSIRDNPTLNRFTVTMTELMVNDSGRYSCGIYSSWITVLKTITLVVSQAPASPAIRSSKTTVPASTTSPVIVSTQDNLKFIIPSVVVAALLLLLLILLVVLYLRKVRGRARKGEAESYHVYNELSVQKETTGFHEQMVSDEDAEDIHIHYASPIHLNHFGTEDSIYVNIQARPKPPPDPFLTVEYASIAGNRPQPSQLTALEGEPRN
ncbi:CMRF35-like molecule 5 [Tupaia chinensis]|uniref:CMRF35-like molecule 5 n=1 Tax=Tupaia chinensis TaxID=246437 RepID=UPI000FFB4BC7|nr:CMRF35-like molecule 5 [Tupaia chinensis]